MPTLSSSIVSQDVASMRDVEEALARQSIHGGDLATNLLELAAVSEERLTRLLADNYNLPAAPLGELPMAPERVRRLLPGELAQRYSLYPLAEQGGTLTLVVSEPLSADLESDLSFSLGTSIAQCVAPLVRIQQAIARDYGIALDRRTQRIIAKLEGRPDPSPSSKPPRAQEAHDFASLRPPTLFPSMPAAEPQGLGIALPRTPTPAPTALRQRSPTPAPSPPRQRTPTPAPSAPRQRTPTPAPISKPVPTPVPPAETRRPTPLPPSVERTPTPAPQTPMQRIATPVPPSARAKPAAQAPARTSALPDLSRIARAETARNKPRRLGPYTAAMAEKDLLAAQTRDDILRAFFDFAAQYFEYAALFAVHDDLAEGRDAHGAGAPVSRVLSIGVPLDLPSALQRAHDSLTHELVRLASGGIDGALAKDLERRAGPQVLLMPIRVRGRCVLIFYGDHGDADVELAAIGDVISFTPLVSKSLEHLIVRKKKKPAAAPPKAEAKPGQKPSQPAPRPPSGLGAIARSMRPQVERQSVLPSVQERAAALAGALGAKPRGQVIPPPPPQAATEDTPVQPKGAAKENATEASVTPSTPVVGTSASVAVAPSVAPLKAAPTKSPDAPPTRVSELPAGSPLDNAIRALGTSQEPTPTDGTTPRSVGTRNAVAQPVLAVGARGKTPMQGSVGPLPSSVPEAQRSIKPQVRPISSEPPEEGWDVAQSQPSFPAAARVPQLPNSDHTTKPGLGVPGSMRATQPGVGAAPELPATPPEQPPVTSRRGGLPRLQLVAEQSAPPPPLDEAPDLSVSDMTMEEVAASWVTHEEGVPLAPASRAAAHSARPLPPREASRELDLPSVIVDVANDVREVVKRLLNGDAAAIEQVVRMGDPAITLLVGMFPGPITAELRRGVGDGPPKASDCGPVLRALSRIGPRAAPFLVVRTADANPAVRAWATRLLGEMPSPESIRAIARRFLDENIDVQRAALAAGNLLGSNSDAQATLSYSLAEIINDPSQPEQARHAIIEAIADLRDTRSIPMLIRLLEDRSEDVAHSAHWALCVLTRQDFGMLGAQWDEWWRHNSTRHRIEWLIDGLMHDNPEIRRGSGDELKALTKEYFGYYDDLPAKERQRAQHRYREWWEAKGKARFR